MGEAQRGGLDGEDAGNLAVALRDQLEGEDGREGGTAVAAGAVHRPAAQGDEPAAAAGDELHKPAELRLVHVAAGAEIGARDVAKHDDVILVEIRLGAGEAVLDVLVEHCALREPSPLGHAGEGGEIHRGVAGEPDAQDLALVARDVHIQHADLFVHDFHAMPGDKPPVAGRALEPLHRDAVGLQARGGRFDGEGDGDRPGAAHAHLLAGGQRNGGPLLVEGDAHGLLGNAAGRNVRGEDERVAETHVRRGGGHADDAHRGRVVAPEDHRVDRDAARAEKRDHLRPAVAAGVVAVGKQHDRLDAILAAEQFGEGVGNARGALVGRRGRGVQRSQAPGESIAGEAETAARGLFEGVGGGGGGFEARLPAGGVAQAHAGRRIMQHRDGRRQVAIDREPEFDLRKHQQKHPYPEETEQDQRGARTTGQHRGRQQVQAGGGETEHGHENHGPRRKGTNDGETRVAHAGDRRSIVHAQKRPEPGELGMAARMSGCHRIHGRDKSEEFP